MKYSKFPRSGEPISRLGFGAMGFAGWFGEDTEDNFIAALHRALELGINFVDTARQYGQSERIVGLALRRWTGRKPFVATKVQALGPNSQWQFPVEVETAFPPGTSPLTANAASASWGSTSSTFCSSISTGRPGARRGTGWMNSKSSSDAARYAL